MFKLLVLFLLSFNACAFDEWAYSDSEDTARKALIAEGYKFTADEWATKDKVLEGAFITLTVIDWLQTRNIARHNCTNPETGLHDCYENGTASLFIGNNPSVGQVNSYFAATILAHIAITNFLPSKYRTIYQGATITLSAETVYHNYKLGISATF